MISLITCSRTPQLSQELQDNIAATIGCEYELVTIDNSTNKYNIFQAYNEGVRRAKGDILCFCHDDIMFHSQDWGEKEEKILSNNNCGILGVFGSHFISQAPLYWWSYPYISQYSINTDNGNAEKQIHCDFYHNNLAEVTVVDGVCFFIMF
ncbi:MAG: glycosyltransferase family protein, partial [bacterium]|nr:glycosyltransferase family protein [bacterium]